MAYRGIMLCMLLAGVAFGQSFLTPFDASLLQFAGGGGGSDIPRDGLVAEYLFTSDASDTSGNGFNGVGIGDPVYGGTLQLDGNDHITLSTNLWAESKAQFAMSVWTKTASAAGIVASKYNTASKRSWYFAHRDGGSGARAIFIVSPNGEYATSAKVYYSTNAIYTDNNWHHFVMDFDGTNLSCWADGTNITSELSKLFENAMTNVFGSNGCVPMIGRAESIAEYHDGRIDNLRIYERSLTDAEIEALYNEGHD